VDFELARAAQVSVHATPELLETEALLHADHVDVVAVKEPAAYVLEVAHGGLALVEGRHEDRDLAGDVGHHREPTAREFLAASPLALGAWLAEVKMLVP
jgi:hypothetical protein